MAGKVANGTDTVESRDEAVEGVLLDTMTSALKKLIARGKERGYVTYDELNAALPSDQVSSEMIEDTMAMLGDIGINVVERGDPEDGEAAVAGPRKPLIPVRILADLFPPHPARLGRDGATGQEQCGPVLHARHTEAQRVIG